MSAVILHEGKQSPSKAKVCYLFLNLILYNFESMSKIIVVINQSNTCLDKNDTYVMSYSIPNMLEYI